MALIFGSATANELARWAGVHTSVIYSIATDGCFRVGSLAYAQRLIYRGEQFHFHRHPSNLYPIAKAIGRQIKTTKLKNGGWMVSVRK